MSLELRWQSRVLAVVRHGGSFFKYRMVTSTGNTAVVMKAMPVKQLVLPVKQRVLKVQLGVSLKKFETNKRYIAHILKNKLKIQVLLSYLYYCCTFLRCVQALNRSNILLVVQKQVNYYISLENMHYANSMQSHASRQGRRNSLHFELFCTLSLFIEDSGSPSNNGHLNTN
jgi:hypothetical protein